MMDEENVLDAVLDGKELVETPPTGDTQENAAPAQPVEAPPAPVTAPPAATQQGHGVDLPAFLRVRDDLNAAKRQLAEYHRREQVREERERQSRAQAPDMFADPEGYHAFWQEQLQGMREEVLREAQETIVADRLAASEEKWRDKLGPEKWVEMNKWLAQLPDQAKASLRFERDPYGAAEKHWRRQETANRLGDKNLDELIEEEVAKRIAAAQAAAPAQPAPQAAPQPGQPRTPNGQFASPPPQPAQRRSAPSLNDVNGAAVGAGSESAGPALDELYS